MLKTEGDFGRFFKEGYSRFYYFAYQMVSNEEVCRDIVSDAFSQAWDVFQTGKVTNWNSYMYTLVRNKCVDYIRYETAKEHYADFYLHTFSEEDEEEDEMQEQIEIMYRMMEEFTPQTAKVLELCYFQKKTYKQAADELGISTSAIKKHIVAALKAFREEIAKKTK